MRIEKVFSPVGSIHSICLLYVHAHDCGEELGNEENNESGVEVLEAGVCRSSSLALLTVSK
jgi:hypothetical protein